jgi:hypothetical protein
MSDANDPKKWNINYSWNQPYSYNTWQYYAANQNALEIELDRLDAIDLLVDFSGRRGYTKQTKKTRRQQCLRCY